GKVSAGVRLIIPDDPALAGKRVSVALDLKLTSVEHFEKRTPPETQHVTIRPATSPVASWHPGMMPVAIGPLLVVSAPLLYLGVRATSHGRLSSPGRILPSDAPVRGPTPPAPVDAIKPRSPIREKTDGQEPSDGRNPPRRGE